MLLLLAVWLTATGHIMLHGFPLEVLEGLARGRGLIRPADAPPVDGLALLGRLPGDSVAWAGWATAGINSLAALLLYLSCRRSWANPISPVLALAAAFFGPVTMWASSTTPGDSLLHLGLALALIALMAGAVPLLAGLVLAVAVLAPSQALALFLALAYLGYRRQTAYGLALPTAAVFGVGCLLIPMAAGYRMEPGLGGWQLWSALPLALALIPSELRAARGGIYLSLLLGSALTGSAELASVLALGDLAFVALQACRPTFDSETAAGPAAERTLPGEPLEGGRALRLSAVSLGGAVATVILVAVALPGERYLNSSVLIAAHKKDVPLSQLFRIFSLDQHARGFVQEPWRARAPIAGLSAADCEQALGLGEERLPDGICPLTLDGLAERRDIALLYSLISNQRLVGWDNPASLAPPLLLSKLQGRNLLSQGPTVILRQDGAARIAPAPEPPRNPAPLDFRHLMPVPYLPQTVSKEPGAGYRWVSAEQSYEVSFPKERAVVLVSEQEDEVRLASLRKGGARRHLEVAPTRWLLAGLPSQTALPSRSLVPVSLTLSNQGEGPLSSRMIASWRFEVRGGESWNSFLQENPKEFLLFPGETTDLDFQLSTPEGEGVFEVRAVALTVEGKELEVPLAGSSQIRTWRRTPAVGTWVEEP